MIKLFISDMDHTLLDNNSQLPHDIEDVINLVEESGARLAIASGRTLTNLHLKFGHLKDRLSYISDNGAVLMHDGEILFTDIINKDAVLDAVLKLREATESTTVVITPEMAYYENDNEEHYQYLTEYYNNLILVDDLTDYTDNIIKITTLSLTHNFENFENHINGKLDDTIEGVPSGAVWVDITNKGVNKAKALDILLKNINVPKDKAVVFGDYYNDLEMIKLVKYGFAVENAPEDIKEQAYGTIGNNDEGAVVTKIRSILDTKRL